MPNNVYDIPSDYTLEVNLEILDLDSQNSPTVYMYGSSCTVEALPERRYICEEVSTLSFTPCSTGICSIRFTSSSPATFLTVPNTVMWLNDFDPTSLEINKVYELNIMDGIYGVAACWDLEEAVEAS